MANTVATRTTIANILKQVYAPAIIEMTAQQVALLQLLERITGKLGIGGESFIIPLEENQMGSTGARGEDGTLPDALPATWQRTIVPIYANYFSISVTGLARATSNTNTYAWAEAWQREAFIKTRAFRQHINRQLNGDGNGILAQVDGSPVLAGSDYTITLDNAFGLSGYANSDVNGHRFISSNMKVDFYSGSSLRDEGAVKITGYTPGAFPSTSATITCASGDCDQVVDGDYMYVAGAKGYEIPGLRLLIDDGVVAVTFQSLSTSTVPDWKANVKYGSTPGTAEAFTTNRAMDLIDDIESVGGGVVDAFVTSNAVWLTIGEMMRQERYMVNEEVLDTGWTVIRFQGKPIYKDPYSIDHLYAIDKRAIKLHEAAPPGWLDYDGDVIKQDGDKDNWKAYWGWYMTPAIQNRKWCGKIQDISVTANKF